MEDKEKLLKIIKAFKCKLADTWVNNPNDVVYDYNGILIRDKVMNEKMTIGHLRIIDYSKSVVTKRFFNIPIERGVIRTYYGQVYIRIVSKDNTIHSYLDEINDDIPLLDEISEFIEKEKLKFIPINEKKRVETERKIAEKEIKDKLVLEEASKCNLNG